MPQTKSFTLAQISTLTQAELKGDPNHQIFGAADLSSASPTDISYLTRNFHKEKLLKSQAGAFFIHSTAASLVVERNCLICQNPELAFQRMIDVFYENQKITGFSGIHPTAVIHHTALIGKDVVIGPYAVIDQDVKIGDRSTISAGCFIGLGTTVGSDCLIHPHAVIREKCHLGDRVIIQPGVIIGSCGFGYTQDHQGRHIKLSHTGNVQIANDVEIGANSCIDRAHFETTHIKRGTKIDNLVQIAHNVIIGENSIIAGQVGIAGSTTIGEHVMIGGKAAINGHLTIAPRTKIAAFSGVSKSLKSGTYGGIPATPIEKSNRIQVFVRNIETYVNQIKEMQRILKMVE